MNMPDKHKSSGFTLIELMVTLTIISIIAMIAMPMYRNYIDTSNDGVMVANLSTMEVFQEDFRLRNGAYAVDLADTAAITAAIGWDPQSVGSTYVVADSDGTTYSVTGTNSQGHAVCMVLPARTRC